MAKQNSNEHHSGASETFVEALCSMNDARILASASTCNTQEIVPAVSFMQGNTNLTPIMALCALIPKVLVTEQKAILVQAANTLLERTDTILGYDGQGNTTFMWTAWSGDHRIVEKCTARAATLDQLPALLETGQNQGERNALSVALTLPYCTQDVVKAVVNGMLQADVDHTHVKLLHQCAMNAKAMPLVGYLLEHGAEPNAKIPDTEITIFDGLCKHVFELKMQVANAPTAEAKLTATKCLVEQLPPIREVINSLAHHPKFDVNLKDNTGYTQGMWSIDVADPLLLEFLVREKGFDVNEFDVGHYTLLHHQGNYRCLPMVKELLKQHANVNAETLCGVDPVQLAIFNPSKMHPDKLKPVIDAFIAPDVQPPYNPLHETSVTDNAVVPPVSRNLTAEGLIDMLLGKTDDIATKADLIASKQALHDYTDRYHAPVVDGATLLAQVEQGLDDLGL